MPEAKRPVHILLTSDGSDESLRAIPHVGALARKLSARVTLLRVMPEVMRSGRGFAAPESLLKKTATEEMKAGRRELAAVLPSFPKDVAVEVAVTLAESIQDGILEFASQNQVDLIAMSSHGRSGLSRLLLGSTAEAVLRDSNLPVAIFRDPAEQPLAPTVMAEPLIVVTTDFSRESERAFTTARDLAKALGARIELVHGVLDAPAIPHGAPLAPPLEDPELEPTIQAAEKKLGEIAQRLGGGSAVATAVVTGPSVSEAIAKHATDRHAEFLVVATHGRSGVRRLVMGSVAEEILRRSHVPVVIVPIQA